LLAQATGEPELMTMLPGLPNYHAVVRLTAAGEQLPPFAMRTLPMPVVADPKLLAAVRTRARALAMPRSEVMRRLEM
jgi:hypothetical protein